jgi:hypothetical protein
VKPTATTAATPAPVSTPSPGASPTVTPALKAGDKVKVKQDGRTLDATVVSVDDKAGTAIVRISGERQDKTVNLSDITKS